MKILFIKPLPRIDRVIPAGYILDAPEGFAKKMVQTGRAVFAGKDAIEQAPKAEEVPVVPEVPEVPVAIEPPAEVAEAPEEVKETTEEVKEEAPKPKRTTRKKRDAE